MDRSQAGYWHGPTGRDNSWFSYQLSVVRGMKSEVWGMNYEVWSRIISILNTQFSILKLALNCPLSLILCLGSWFLVLLSEVWSLKQNYLNAQYSILKLALNCPLSLIFDPLSLIFCLGSWFLALVSWNYLKNSRTNYSLQPLKHHLVHCLSLDYNHLWSPQFQISL